MHVRELDYDLPDALIAQEPLPERDAGRLLVLDAETKVQHRVIRELPKVVKPALWIFNDTRVLSARLFGEKADSGGKVELLLVERRSRVGVREHWSAMGRSSKGFRVGMRITLHEGALEAVVDDVHDDGFLEVELRGSEPVSPVIQRVGHMPLPPYIQRSSSDVDRDRYQTVFAHHPGAVAAPTAGLHFSPALLSALEAAGHRVAYVTLHVGPGTFLPLRTEDLESHRMHEERYVVPPATASAVEEARRNDRPVVAVGTTVLRTLETVAEPDGRIRIERGRTDLLIYPPYDFKVADAIVTNFHLPRSTLLALVMAFGGIEPVRRAYAEAVRERYRFYSYGDAMLIVRPTGAFARIDS